LMLFPSGPLKTQPARRWYMIPHDDLYSYVEAKHSTAPTWAARWSYPYIPLHLAAFLAEYEVRPTEAVTE
jgi:hypothetical protein